MTNISFLAASTKTTATKTNKNTSIIKTYLTLRGELSVSAKKKKDNKEAKAKDKMKAAELFTSVVRTVKEKEAHEKEVATAKEKVDKKTGSKDENDWEVDNGLAEIASSAASEKKAKEKKLAEARRRWTRKQGPRTKML